MSWESFQDGNGRFMRADYIFFQKKNIILPVRNRKSILENILPCWGAEKVNHMQVSFLKCKNILNKIWK